MKAIAITDVCVLDLSYERLELMRTDIYYFTTVALEDHHTYRIIQISSHVDVLVARLYKIISK